MRSRWAAALLVCAVCTPPSLAAGTPLPAPAGKSSKKAVENLHKKPSPAGEKARRGGGASPARVEVPAQGDALARLLATVKPGTTLRLLPGTHRGGVMIDKTLRLEGMPGAVVEGNGKGSVVRVTAPGVILRGLTLRRSGEVEPDLDSGILLEKGAAGAIVEENRVEENLFGITVQGPPNCLIRNNHVANRNDLWLNFRGNGINMWNTTGTRIEGNTITGGRDGIFIHTAHGNFIRNNHFTGTRFSVHYMYANDNEVSGNISRGNGVGYALMYSNHLKVFDNLSEDDRDHGLMLHTVHHSEAARNRVVRTQDKCAFVYTATDNNIHHNHFEGCAIGLHFSGGSENNRVYENAFVANRTQVKYPGTVFQEWSRQQRGNFWSDNPAFDLNGDGIADVAYRPNDMVDHVLWNYPLAKLLLSSPVLETLRFAQRSFPALSPGGIVDSWPLMQPPSATPTESSGS